MIENSLELRIVIHEIKALAAKIDILQQTLSKYIDPNLFNIAEKEADNEPKTETPRNISH